MLWSADQTLLPLTHAATSRVRPSAPSTTSAARGKRARQVLYAAAAETAAAETAAAETAAAAAETASATASCWWKHQSVAMRGAEVSRRERRRRRLIAGWICWQLTMGPSTQPAPSAPACAATRRQRRSGRAGRPARQHTTAHQIHGSERQIGGHSPASGGALACRCLSEEPPGLAAPQAETTAAIKLPSPSLPSFPGLPAAPPPAGRRQRRREGPAIEAQAPSAAASSVSAWGVITWQLSWSAESMHGCRGCMAEEAEEHVASKHPCRCPPARAPPPAAARRWLHGGLAAPGGPCSARRCIGRWVGG